jgi:CII-binding regulator of phage lambda lysogenization HflD
MKYKFHISYPDGRYHLWNAMSGNEWQVMFEYEEQMLKFMRMLLEEV